MALAIAQPCGYVALVAFLCSCALIIALGTYARSSQRRANEADRRKVNSPGKTGS